MDLDFIKRYPILTGILAVCLIGFAVEVFFVVRAHSSEVKESKLLKTAQNALSTAMAAKPAPSDDNLQAAKQNVTQLQKQLDDIVSSLQATDNKTAPPADAVALLADIQHFVDNFSALAKQDQITIADPANFTFGMGQYVGPVTPPPPDKIAVVFKQMQVLEYILNQLFNGKMEGQSMVLESVERETVVPLAQGNNPNDAGPKDVFTVDPLVSARVKGAVDTLAFRVKFIAYTDTLRVFLDNLAKFELPLVVRSVEVEPATQDTVNAAIAAANPAAAGAAPAPAPAPDASAGNTTAAPSGPQREAVIKDNVSEFTVVIEYINLIPPKAVGSTPAS